MELFLTSSVHAVAHDIAQKVNLGKAKELVFIDTAAEPKMGDKTWLKNDRQALVNAGFLVTDYTLTGKAETQLKKDLAAFDYIYMSGGDTSYLLQQARRSGFVYLVRKLVKDKIYIGTSAGSIIAGPKIPAYLTEDSPDMKSDDLTAFGLVNFTIAPHWGSDDFKQKYLGGRMKIAYEKRLSPLVLLSDSQYIHVLDGKTEIIDVDAE